MREVLKDRNGRQIGTIETISGKKILRDQNGKRLGEYDGRQTRDSDGRIVGTGDLLASLLVK